MVIVRAKARCNNILINKSNTMIYSQEVQHMCVVKKGPNHGPAPIPEEGKWVRSKEIKDIQGRYHRRSIGRNYRLRRYDPLCRYGI